MEKRKTKSFATNPGNPGNPFVEWVFGDSNLNFEALLSPLV